MHPQLNKHMHATLCFLLIPNELHLCNMRWLTWRLAIWSYYLHASWPSQSLCVRLAVGIKNLARTKLHAAAAAHTSSFHAVAAGKKKATWRNWRRCFREMSDCAGGARGKTKGLLGFSRIHSPHDPFNPVRTNSTLKLQNIPFLRIPFRLITHRPLKLISGYYIGRRRFGISCLRESWILKWKFKKNVVFSNNEIFSWFLFELCPRALSWFFLVCVILFG